MANDGPGETGGELRGRCPRTIKAIAEDLLQHEYEQRQKHGRGMQGHSLGRFTLGELDLFAIGGKAVLAGSEYLIQLTRVDPAKPDRLDWHVR